MPVYVKRLLCENRNKPPAVVTANLQRLVSRRVNAREWPREASDWLPVLGFRYIGAQS
jgi:hypothetical protein